MVDQQVDCHTKGDEPVRKDNKEISSEYLLERPAVPLFEEYGGDSTVPAGTGIGSVMMTAGAYPCPEPYHAEQCIGSENYGSRK